MPQAIVNYYSVLGIPITSSRDTIHQALERKMRNVEYLDKEHPFLRREHEEKVKTSRAKGGKNLRHQNVTDQFTWLEKGEALRALQVKSQREAEHRRNLACKVAGIKQAAFQEAVTAQTATVQNTASPATYSATLRADSHRSSNPESSSTNTSRPTTPRTETPSSAPKIVHISRSANTTPIPTPLARRPSTNPTTSTKTLLTDAHSILTHPLRKYHYDATNTLKLEAWEIKRIAQFPASAHADAAEAHARLRQWKASLTEGEETESYFGRASRRKFEKWMDEEGGGGPSGGGEVVASRVSGAVIGEAVDWMKI